MISSVPPSPTSRTVANAKLSFLVPAALALGAAVLVVPFWAALLLAAWVGVLLRPMADGFAGRIRGHVRIAAAFTLFFLSLILLPIGIAVAAMAAQAVSFVHDLLATNQARAILENLVSHGSDGHEWNAGDLVDLATSQAENAWALLKLVAGAASKAALDVIVFYMVAFAVIVDGRAAYRFAERHLPLPSTALARFAAAFNETGRALLVGSGGGAAAQGIAATITYLALGVPRAFLLGVLTAIAAFVPAIGTVIVWGPVAAGLFATGRYAAGIALVVIGLVLIGGIDNFLRPVLTRGARLQLPLVVVVLSMFGGLALLGPAGLLLGVLVVRLAKEALVLMIDDPRPSCDHSPTPPSPRTDHAS